MEGGAHDVAGLVDLDHCELLASEAGEGEQALEAAVPVEIGPGAVGASGDRSVVENRSDPGTGLREGGRSVIDRDLERPGADAHGREVDPSVPVEIRQLDALRVGVSVLPGSTAKPADGLEAAGPVTDEDSHLVAGMSDHDQVEVRVAIEVREPGGAQFTTEAECEGGLGEAAASQSPQELEPARTGPCRQHQVEDAVLVEVPELQPVDRLLETEPGRRTQRSVPEPRQDQDPPFLPPSADHEVGHPVLVEVTEVEAGGCEPCRQLDELRRGEVEGGGLREERAPDRWKQACQEGRQGRGRAPCSVDLHGRVLRSIHGRCERPAAPPGNHEFNPVGDVRGDRLHEGAPLSRRRRAREQPRRAGGGDSRSASRARCGRG